MIGVETIILNFFPAKLLCFFPLLSLSPKEKCCKDKQGNSDDRYNDSNGNRAASREARVCSTAGS